MITRDPISLSLLIITGLLTIIGWPVIALCLALAGLIRCVCDLIRSRS